jgi:hypothetical protein
MIAFPARTAGAVAAALLTLACRGPGPSADQLAERLRTFDQRRASPDPLPSIRGLPLNGWHSYPPAPDAHGTVVAQDGDRLAVRLDIDVPFPASPVGMAILEDDVYKGELIVFEVWRGHALGRFFAVGKQPVRIGDRASCKTP